MEDKTGANASGVRILTIDPREAAQWLCRELFFQDVSTSACVAVRTGALLVELCCPDSDTDPYLPDALQYGLRHIALETDNITQALRYCRERGMRLQTGVSGAPRFSGKVYGTGLHYFNILTDFGVTVEVTEKHANSPRNAPYLIWGLGHIGIQTGDLMRSLLFYRELGFREDFPPVENKTADGAVRCCMTSRDGLTLELYEFHDRPNLPIQRHPALAALLCGGKNSRSLPEEMVGPSGEQIENRQSLEDLAG